MNLQHTFSRSLLVTALCLPALSLAATETAAKTLTVYTYDSFVTEWGPAPKLKAAFEAQCACKLDFVSVEDGVSLLNRLRIEGERTKADVLLGIDDALMEETRATGLIAEHDQDLSPLKTELSWTDTQFLPYDYGYFAFVYDSSKIETPPSSLKELVASDASIIYQDPRTSTPGQGLLTWMNAVYGEETAAAWQQLAQNTVTITKGWSEAYSMFLQDSADYVLSYTTSPAYHIVAEDKQQYQAALFAEGHIAQIELAAILTTTQQPELAQQFLRFLISPEAQAILPVTNWMLPVIDKVDLPAAFAQLVQPKRIVLDPAQRAEQRRDWINVWRRAAAK